MKEYLKYLTNLEECIEERDSKIGVIEKDYPTDTLPTDKHKERKERIGKVQNDFEQKFKKNISLLDRKIKAIRNEQPHLTELSITKKEKFPSFIVFGRLKISTNFMKEIFIPRIFTFPINKALYSFDVESISFIQQFILRILQVSPLKKIELVLIDTLNLGKSLSFMRGVLENDFIYNQRILTYSDEIEEGLKGVADYLENLIQKQLTGYKDWNEYNRKNPKSILPLKIIVVMGVPEQFTKNSMLYLNRIIQFGPKVGILPLVLIHDNEKNNDLKSHLVKYGEEFENIKFKFKEKFNHLNFQDELELLPNKNELQKLINNINNFYAEDSKIKGEIDEFWDEKLWSNNSVDGIKVPIGWDKNQEKVFFEIGSDNSEHHTLIGGRSGSGKSNLVHVIIQNIAYYYSPDEVELYLLDYKEGVEFNSYVNPPLIHSSLIAIHSDINYGHTFLQFIIEEKNKRAELFKEKNVKDFQEYRERVSEKLSRIIIIIDEFQVLFSTKNSVKIEKLFVEILRKGRSYGIHLILSTQTLKGIEANSMSQLKSQIGNRIALVMSEEDSMAVLSTQNTEAAKLKGKPEAIYNDMGGMKDGNKKIFIPFASRENLEKLLKLINSQNYNKKIKIYNGEYQPILPAQSFFINENFELYLGKELNFTENDFKINFKKEIGNNLIISGRGKREKQNIINSLMKNFSNNTKLNHIYYFNQDEDIVVDIDTCDEIIFNSEIEENSFIVIDSFDGYQELHPKQGYGGLQKEVSASDKFKEIVEYGYKKNIYTIIFIDNFKRSQVKFRDFLSLFELRLGFTLNEESTNALLSVSNSSMLKAIPKNQAIFSNLITSEMRFLKLYRGEND
jgi:hypothetical protein